MSLYPLKFDPILKSIIWGGSDICKFKGIEPQQDGIGESWEVSGVEGNISVVDSGSEKGKNLQDLIAEYKEQLVGKHNFEKFGTTFPLLIKFIDARDNLSIQVHPDDVLAKQRHNSFGKTEMWYVINAAPGSGTFIAEIQQTSNITYRIYDYKRKDANGNGRELHTELAKDAIDYKLYDSYQLSYIHKENTPVQLESCQYFTTNLLELDKAVIFDQSNKDSFIIYICMEGACQIEDGSNTKVDVKQGTTVLIPAANAAKITITPKGFVQLLETFA